MADGAEMVGQGIAGGLIASNILRTLVEKDLLTISDVGTIFDRSITAVSRPINAEEFAAWQTLKDLKTKLFPSS